MIIIGWSTNYFLLFVWCIKCGNFLSSGVSHISSLCLDMKVRLSLFFFFSVFYSVLSDGASLQGPDISAPCTFWPLWFPHTTSHDASLLTPLPLLAPRSGLIYPWSRAPRSSARTCCVFDVQGGRADLSCFKVTPPIHHHQTQGRFVSRYQTVSAELIKFKHTHRHSYITHTHDEVFKEHPNMLISACAWPSELAALQLLCSHSFGFWIIKQLIWRSVSSSGRTVSSLNTREEEAETSVCLLFPASVFTGSSCLLFVVYWDPH